MTPNNYAIPTAQIELNAIYISIEMSRKTWLVTSLSPGAGEKISRHMVVGGDSASLLARLDALCLKALDRTGQRWPIIVIHEAGFDGFWVHRVLVTKGYESHVVDAASIATSRRRLRVKTDRLDGETLIRALLAFKTWGTACVLDAESSVARGGGSPAHWSRAQDSVDGAYSTQQSHQGTFVLTRHYRIQPIAA
jgi:hypothetical protein